MTRKNSYGILCMGALTAIGLLCPSCSDDGRIWTKSVSLPGSEWSADRKLIFEPDSDILMKDKASRLIMFVRYRGDSNFQTLPLLVETESEAVGHEYSVDSVKIKLFDEGGIPAGKGNFGTYEKADTFSMLYPIPPGWTMTVRPVLDNENAKGIVDFGITLLK